MATIVIAPYSGINPVQSGDNLTVSGAARCEGMGPTEPDITWSAEFDPTATAAQINNAIRDAAVAAAAAADPSYTVGALDNKIIVGAATGLL